MQNVESKKSHLRAKFQLHVLSTVTEFPVKKKYSDVGNSDEFMAMLLKTPAVNVQNEVVFAFRKRRR